MDDGCMCGKAERLENEELIGGESFLSRVWWEGR